MALSFLAAKAKKRKMIRFMIHHFPDVSTHPSFRGKLWNSCNEFQENCFAQHYRVQDGEERARPLPGSVLIISFQRCPFWTPCPVLVCTCLKLGAARLQRIALSPVLSQRGVFADGLAGSCSHGSDLAVDNANPGTYG